MNHPADIRHFRELDRIAREQDADEAAALEIEAALLAGESIRYGHDRYQTLDAEDVRNEFAPDMFRAVALAIAAGDAIEAGCLFAVEHTRAIVAIAKRHAGLRASYLVRDDAEELAADRHALRMDS